MDRFDTLRPDTTLCILFKKKPASKPTQQKKMDSSISQEEHAIELLKEMIPEQIMAVISSINK